MFPNSQGLEKHKIDQNSLMWLLLPLNTHAVRSEPSQTSMMDGNI